MSRHPIPTAVSAVVAAMLLVPTPTHAKPAGDCALDPAFLPHTADSAQAWFDTCRQQASLPRTADAAEAWLARTSRTP